MVGSTIDGRYQVLRVLGEGGMGAVYEARHTGTGRRVALKVIRGDVAGNAEMVQRFQREARMVGALDTPHVVDIFDTGTDPATGLIYMAMELLQGEDLRTLLKRVRRLKPEVAMRLVAQACRGLGKAHDASVIHRDIKPANLFLSCMEGGEIVVKVVDFGIAKTLGAHLLGDSLTRTGNVLGSPHYMSPEQAKGRKNLDRRTDIWSLGVVLYQTLSGRVPHVREDDALELMLRICTQPAPPIQSIAPWVQPGVAVIVHRMLSLDLDARFQSAAEVIAAMRPWLGDDHRVHASELAALSDADAAQVAPRASLPEDDATVRDYRSLMVPVVHDGAASGPKPRPGEARPEVTERLTASAPTSTAVLATAVPANVATSGSLQTHSVPQDTTTTIPFLRPKPRLRPAVVIPIAFAVGIGGQIAYRLIDHPALASADVRASAEAPSTGSEAPIMPPASADPPKPSTPPIDERTVHVAIEPADATVEIDGQPAPVHDGAIELRGALGSAHSVRVVKGTQEITAAVAITPVGAVPARMRIEPKPAPQARPYNKALNRRFE